MRQWTTVSLLDGGRMSIHIPQEYSHIHKTCITINKQKCYLNLINFKEVTKEEYLKLKKSIQTTKNNIIVKTKFGKIKNNNKIMFTTLIEPIMNLTKIELFINKKSVYEVVINNKNISNQKSIINRISKTFMKVSENDILDKIKDKIEQSKTINIYKYYYGSLF